MTAKGGDVVLADLSTPDRVRPGEEVAIEMTIQNRTLLVSPWDNDRCATDDYAGYSVRGVVIGPDGERVESPGKCVELRTATYGEETARVTLNVPETAGTYRYEAFAELTGSGETTDRRNSDIEVYSPGDEPEEPPEDDPDDGDDSNPFSFGLNLSKKEKVALGAGGLLLAAAVLRPYATMGASASKVVT